MIFRTGRSDRCWLSCLSRTPGRWCNPDDLASCSEQPCTFPPCSFPRREETCRPTRMTRSFEHRSSSSCSRWGTSSARIQSIRGWCPRVSAPPSPRRHQVDSRLPFLPIPYRQHRPRRCDLRAHPVAPSRQPTHPWHRRFRQSHLRPFHHRRNSCPECRCRRPHPIAHPPARPHRSHPFRHSQLYSSECCRANHLSFLGNRPARCTKTRWLRL